MAESAGIKAGSGHSASGSLTAMAAIAVVRPQVLEYVFPARMKKERRPEGA